jgi:hypothetical protein
MMLTIRASTNDDKHLPWVDYSTLTAVNMCPRWGIVNSYMGKRMAIATQRSTALEAGKAMHDVFAAVRMFELLHSVQEVNDLQIIGIHGQRLFTRERWGDFVERALSGEDYATAMMQSCLYMLESSGYHDDPYDKKRTLRNLEDAAILYIDRYPKRRFIPYFDRDTGVVGVEQHFDLVIEPDDRSIQPFRFVGKIDGYCRDTLRSGKLSVHENKTGSRIDTVWSDGFTVNHQVSGYIAAINTLFPNATRVDSAEVWGLQLPVPSKSMYGDGQSRMTATRNNDDMLEWSRWLLHTWQMIVAHKDDAAAAPMYTHSCSRYFSSCAFIPLCALSYSERKHVIEKEMIENRWNPTEDQ